jgi:hypothetical protein
VNYASIFIQKIKFIMKKLFFISYCLLTTLFAFGQATAVISAEYFIDTDMGVGSGTPIPLSISAASVTQSTSIPTTGLPTGFHNLYIRTKDDLGKWSLTEGRTFFIYTNPVAPPAGATQIVKAEYFIDTDLGVGNGTNIPITNGANVNLSIGLPTTGFATGFHNLYIRTKDDLSKWSLTESRTFYIYSNPPPPPVGATQIIAAEYFIDNDLGVGNGTPITNLTPNATVVLSPNLATTAAVGTHYLYIRTKDNLGKWSLSEGRQFTVDNSCIAPAIVSQTLNTTLDVGQTATFNVNMSGTAPFTYRWFKTTNPTATLSATASYAIAAAALTDAGDYQCEISNGCGSIISATAHLTVNPLCVPPTAPYVGAPHAIAGCGNVGAKAQRRDANFQGIGGLTFEWYEFDATMPDNKGALLKIQTTTNADPISFYNWNPTPTGAIQIKKVVVYENLGGCYSPNAVVELTVFPMPVNDLAIVGATTACGQVNINAVPPTPLTLTQGVQWWKNSAHDINPSLSLTPNLTTSDETLAFAFVFKTEFRPHVAADLTCFSDPLFFGLTVKPLPVVSITNLAIAYCQNAASITLSGLPIGGGFTIDGIAATTLDPSVLTIGNHTITYSFTGTNGCSNSITQTVSINAPPTVSITNLATNYCKNGSPITLTGLPIGGSFTIDGIAATTFDAASLTVGNHTVTYSVTVNGCSNSASQTVLINAQPSITIAANPTTLCAGQSSQLSATISGIATGYTISWDNGLGNGGIKSTGPLSINTTFTASVTTTAGCTAISSPLTVVVNPIPTVSITNLAIAYCKNAAPITLTGLPTGGSFTIDGNAATTFDATALTVGNHTVTYSVTVNGCSNSASQTVLINAQPSITIAANPTAICAGQSSQLTATVSGIATGYTISWDNGLGNGGIKSTGPLSINTTFSASVTTTAGCTAISSPLTVVVNPIPTVSITNLATNYCQNAAPITLTGLPIGGSFTIDGIAATTFDASALTVGNHTITYNFTNANGCSNSINQTVSINTPSITTTNTSISNCINTALTLTATPSFTPATYAWSTGATTAAISVTATGVYSVTATGGSCQSVIQIFTVTNGAPMATLQIDNPDCYREKGVITVVVASATGYQFRKNGGAWQSSPIFSNLSAGNYVIETRLVGTTCVRSLTASILSAPNRLTASVLKTNITCAGANNGQIRAVNVSGGVTPYQFSIDSVQWQLDSVFTNLSAGIYKLFIRDANSCILVKTNIEILDPSVLTLVLDSTNQIKCNGAATGKIFTTATGGTGAKMYSKNNGTTWQTSSDFTNLPVGTYILRAKDANNCLSNVITTILTEPTALSFSTVKTNETCNDANNGTISIAATGGVNPLEYSRNNGSSYQNSPNFTGLSAGNYNLKVRDANGCTTASQTVSITQPIGFTFATVMIGATCNGANDGKITVRYFSGGNGGLYQFSKNNGVNWQLDSVFSGLTAGNYAVKMRDAAGCESPVRNITVTQPAPITFVAVINNVSCGYTTNGVIGITTVAGGTPQYKYSKNGGTTFQNGNSFASLPVGIYPIQVKDSKGCLSAVVNSTIVNDCPTVQPLTTIFPTQRIPIVIQKLSPNPTEGELNLEVNSLTIREQQFSFYDILGKEVLSEKRTLEQGINRLTFDCSALPQGAYLILTPGSVGNNQPRRFIKL